MSYRVLISVLYSLELARIGYPLMKNHLVLSKIWEYGNIVSKISGFHIINMIECLMVVAGFLMMIIMLFGNGCYQVKLPSN